MRWGCSRHLFAFCCIAGLTASFQPIQCDKSEWKPIRKTKPVFPSSIYSLSEIRVQQPHRTQRNKWKQKDKTGAKPRLLARKTSGSVITSRTPTYSRPECIQEATFSPSPSSPLVPEDALWYLSLVLLPLTFLPLLVFFTPTSLAEASTDMCPFEPHQMIRPIPEGSLQEALETAGVVLGGTEAKTASAIVAAAAKKALGGGISGVAAAVLQVVSLMWLRTTMNFQYVNGGTFREAIDSLWKEGGLSRLYRGLSFALIQTPVARFGDTAANAGSLALFDALAESGGVEVPLFLRTAGASVAAAVWRVLVLPIDTVKVSLQVRGPEALEDIKERVGKEGPQVLWSGAVAATLATVVGHYPFFLTFNALQGMVPSPEDGEILQTFLRNAFIGVCASSASDVCSNGLRVLKAIRQSQQKEDSKRGYLDIAKEIVDRDGIFGLLGRGLGTRLATNAAQGVVFSVVY
eukprot:Cvel_21594.t1-p1 / transcript=Cvel_21594.t1 / gene=Cvel_21594 / organism=Chromera_velia_CCMP2878 / gene_product=hypothetical protein / transcript_product=hypothetical protein / location=Cvel_scaffold2039:461-5152(-) / protein_length=461 / sequence_SO=supercontig / SO=protein_coding / is_pseudo=false